jgi:hypothetical protein
MSIASIPCPTCERPLAILFCAHCGERRPAQSDHTLKHFLGHLFEAFTHADGKIFLTVRLLIIEPGRLTPIICEANDVPTFRRCIYS